jgi:hypothetical protein
MLLNNQQNVRTIRLYETFLPISYAMYQKKGGMKSPVSNHRDKFRIKRSTDHCCDGVSILSSGSHRLKRGSEYLSGTKHLKEIPKTQNGKARRLRLQYLNSDAGTVEAQPPERDLNARESSRVTPTKRPPDSYIEDADSDLSSDNDSKPIDELAFEVGTNRCYKGEVFRL